MGIKKRQVGAKQRVKNVTSRKTKEQDETEEEERQYTTNANPEVKTSVFNVMSYKGFCGKVIMKKSSKQKELKNCFIKNSEYYHQLSLKIVTILTILTRTYKISEPAHVCWDETHFGKFANHYLNGHFFFDVHPPLGKMLLAFAGWMSNYNGKFQFEKPGVLFAEHNYVGMRMFCACLGGSCVPLVYLTVWKLTNSLPASLLSASFVLFDTGCITISQYILLDPILMFFIMISIYSLVRFNELKGRPYSNEWWAWLFATGLFLGCTISVKWVGLFVVLFVGISTVHDLWDILGNKTISLRDFAKHTASRALGLILVPIFTYIFVFSLHFKYLPKNGPGDAFYSSAFQSTLRGNPLYDAKLPRDLAYGSIVTIKCHKSSGTLLHSHDNVYPKEFAPELQQVTGYSHKDLNNNWRVHSVDAQTTELDPVKLVRDGDVIRLMHIHTGRNLHTHHHQAPFSKHLKQVVAYGDFGLGDVNDHWRIEIVKNPGKNGIINTLRTLFRLRHVQTGCALSETGADLPEWGLNHREIACDSNSNPPYTLWNIESNEHRQLPKINIASLAPSFFEKFVESHFVMATTNSELKPKDNEFNSRPWQWPINFRGQLFSGPDFRVYLLGNPVLWWFVLATLALYLVYFIFFEIRYHRGCEIDPKMTDKSRLVVGTCTWLLIGWALHYFPFYLMSRVLYFHHYFPSYMISSMVAGILLEHVISIMTFHYVELSRQKNFYLASIGFLVFFFVISFYLFRDLTYGMIGPMADKPNATQAAYKWLDSWEI